MYDRFSTEYQPDCPMSEARQRHVDYLYSISQQSWWLLGLTVLIQISLLLPFLLDLLLFVVFVVALVLIPVVLLEILR